MSYPSLNEMIARNGEVHIKTRHWDGIDRPDFVSLDPLSPEQARRWAATLIEQADIAEGQKRERDAAALAAKQVKLEALRQEVAGLERDLAD